MIRKDLVVAAAIGWVIGTVGLVIIVGWTPDVIAASVTVLVVSIWTGAALYAGARIERRRAEQRAAIEQTLRHVGPAALVHYAGPVSEEFRQRLAEAMAAQRADLEAVNDAVKEDR